MTRMITTRDPAVSEIVEEMARRRDVEQTRQDAIRRNWRILKEKGFGYSVQGRAAVILDYEEGRMLYDVMPDDAWRDQRCFIIGGGESLKDFDFSKLKNELVIGVNRAYERIDCTINFAMDHTFYEWITGGRLGQEAKKKFEDFKGLPVWLDSAGYDYPRGIFILSKSSDNNINYSMKDGIGGGTNSGFGALNLAVCLGANPIYLLGFDMKGKDGKQAWWHDGYPDKVGDKIYQSFINDFNRAVPRLKEKEFRVVNLNPESELKCFDFGKFEDIKPIERPIVVSYYTENTGYEVQVEHLKTTLRRFNLENEVMGISNLGSWHKNMYHRPKFILQMMKKHPGRSIVYVDADAKFRMNPVLFNDFDCDFACHFYNRKELLGGTLYFGNTKGARFLVDRWIEEDNLHPKTHMPQKNLHAVFNRHKDSIKWKTLPVEYCMIFDCRARMKTNPVIEHFQLSRKYKSPENKTRGHMLKHTLAEIQEFCLGKEMCIIGNADSVLREKRNIDSFDVIGRMNRGDPRGKEEYIGSHTDILFLSTGSSRRAIQESFDPRFVVWMTANHRLAQPWVLKNAIQNPIEDWYELFNKLSINPTTGMMTLNFVLKHINFKSLTIYGFDFFATKSWYNTQVDSGLKHSGKKEKVLFMEMIKGRPNVRFMS